MPQCTVITVLKAQRKSRTSQICSFSCLLIDVEISISAGIHWYKELHEC
eukprot:jgi/Antlo1/2265/1411